MRSTLPNHVCQGLPPRLLWQCCGMRGFCLVPASQPASVVAKVLDNRRVSPTAINLWVRSIAAPPIRRDSPGGLMLPLSVDMSRGRRRGGLSIRGTGGLRRLIVGSFLIIFDGLPLRGIRTGEAQRGLKSIL